MYELYAPDLAARQATRPRMLRSRAEDLVILCVRHPGLAAQARLHLKPEHYDLQGERACSVLIKHLWALTERTGYAPGLVPRQALFEAIGQEVLNLGRAESEQPWVAELLDDPADPHWGGDSPGLIARAYAADMGRYDDRYAFETLKLFLEERVVHGRVAELIQAAGTRVPKDYGVLLRDVAVQVERIEAIGASPFALPMPDDWVPDPIVENPTGCSWVDTRIGGTADGDVNGILGMFGGGKTTALAQLVTQSGFCFLDAARRENTKPRLAIMVSYEERTKTIRPRIMSCAARVSKTKLETMKSLDQLTRTGKLDKYELALYRDEGEDLTDDLPGEYERLIAARERMNKAIRIVDMRDGGKGMGWVDELTGYIARLQDQEEAEIGLVCVDYVNAMCRRHVDTLPRVNESTFRHLVQRTPLQAEEKIAKRFNCSVWLAQQFSGDANKKVPTAKMMLADASECKSFGENLAFCVGLGAIDPLTKCIQATFVKARRRGVTGTTALLRLDGDLGRLTPADHLFEIVDDKIVDKTIVQKFSGEVATKKPRLAVAGASVLSPWKK